MWWPGARPLIESRPERGHRQQRVITSAYQAALDVRHTVASGPLAGEGSEVRRPDMPMTGKPPLGSISVGRIASRAV